MKTILITTLILLTLATSALAKSDDGAGSSGGGGTLPTRGVQTYEIAEYVSMAKRDLRLIFRGRWIEYNHIRNNNLDHDLEKKLFDGPVTILDILEKTKIELRDSEPCLDGAGKEVDGSIYAKEPNSICISSLMIASKVSTEQARDQVIALIAHELSHLLGTTESEAHWFQYLIFTESRMERSMFGKNENYAYEMATLLHKDTLLLHKKIEETLFYFNDLTAQEINTAIQEINVAFSRVTKESYNPFKYATHNITEIAQLHLQETKLLIASFYTLNNNYGKNQLNEIFKNDQSITYGEFINRTGVNISDDYKLFTDEKIKRLNSKEDLREYLIELQQFSEKENAMAYAIYSNGQLP